MPHVNVFGVITSLAGAVAVMAWRVSETRRPVSLKKIVIPPMGMATGFCMFLVPMFRVPLTWGLAAFATGALALAYPLADLAIVTIAAVVLVSADPGVASSV